MPNSNALNKGLFANAFTCFAKSGVEITLKAIHQVLQRPLPKRSFPHPVHLPHRQQQVLLQLEHLLIPAHLIGKPGPILNGDLHCLHVAFGVVHILQRDLHHCQR